MPEVIGIDHIYIAVTDMARAEQFYAGLFEVLAVLGREETLARLRIILDSKVRAGIS